MIPDGSHITEKGRALIAKLLASRGELLFTRATVGSGVLPDDTDPKTAEDLIHYEMDGSIVEISNPQNGEAAVTIQAFNMELETGFFATEVALWARDPDEGEILYDYFTINEHPEWIRPQPDSVLKLATFTLVTIVSDLPVVYALINPYGLATIKYVDDSISAHNQAPFGPETHPEFWAAITWLQQQVDEANSTPFSADLVNFTNLEINDGRFNRTAGAIEASL